MEKYAKHAVFALLFLLSAKALATASSIIELGFTIALGVLFYMLHNNDVKQHANIASSKAAELDKQLKEINDELKNLKNDLGASRLGMLNKRG